MVIRPVSFCCSLIDDLCQAIRDDQAALGLGMARSRGIQYFNIVLHHELGRKRFLVQLVRSVCDRDCNPYVVSTKIAQIPTPRYSSGEGKKQFALVTAFG